LDSSQKNCDILWGPRPWIELRSNSDRGQQNVHVLRISSYWDRHPSLNRKDFLPKPPYTSSQGVVGLKLGIVICSNDPETVWNAFRLGVFSLNEKEDVKVFLMAKGVECESLDTPQFMVTEQMQAFVENGGEIFACGTCLKIRHSEESEMCPMSTMKDLYTIIKESDKVVTF